MLLEGCVEIMDGKLVS